MLDGDAAGVCKGGAFARNAPLLGFFGAPFLPKQERCELVYLIDKLYLQRVEPHGQKLQSAAQHHENVEYRMHPSFLSADSIEHRAVKWR